MAGGGNVGRYLALGLGGRDHEVTLVERRPAVAQSLPREGLTVVVGDACDVATLERAGAREAEVLVAATGDDEDNLVISLLGKQEFAVPRVMARVNHPTNEWLFDDQWGVDDAISPPHLLAAVVEEQVTAGDLVSLLTLQQGQVELLEVRLDDRSAAVGARVSDLELPAGAVILAVVREGAGDGSAPLDFPR